jgi:hypothetical protein
MKPLTPRIPDAALQSIDITGRRPAAVTPQRQPTAAMARAQSVVAPTGAAPIHGLRRVRSELELMGRLLREREDARLPFAGGGTSSASVT